MRLTMAQLTVGPELEENLNKILAVIRHARPGDWVVFPECALTGYFVENDRFLTDLAADVVDGAISTIARAVVAQECVCLLGTALPGEEGWYNAVVVIEPSGAQQIHRKVELSELDRRHFSPGAATAVLDVEGTRIGIQICRELLFPAAWAQLAGDGAQIVFHINNAIKPYDDVWEHVLIARAVENGTFVCSVNNAAAPQELRSYLVAPSGRLLVRSQRQADQVIHHEIDLGGEHAASPF